LLTLGLLGGMSWESSAEYYRLINERVLERLGGVHSARILMYSFDFDEIEQLQRTDQWDAAGELLAARARMLEDAGAELLVLCTNTMHQLAGAITAAVAIPFLHIADPTAQAILNASYRRVGLLGTRYTMEGRFYRERLEQAGLDVLIPDREQREAVHRIIYEELVIGRVLEESRAAYLEVIDSLAAAGAECVVLGCTEIGLLIRPGDTPVPLFDTTALHARAAAEIALGLAPLPTEPLKARATPV
jgi:aspartate racemase